MDLRKFARGKVCVRCKKQDTSTTSLAHYTGARRLDYGGGFGKKVNDAIGAHLCHDCHVYMDQLSRARGDLTKWDHSEQMLHLCALTFIRVIEAIYEGEL